MTSSPQVDGEFLSEIGPGPTAVGPGAVAEDQPGDLDLADRHVQRTVGAAKVLDGTDAGKEEYCDPGGTR